MAIHGMTGSAPNLPGMGQTTGVNFSKMGEAIAKAYIEANEDPSVVSKGDQDTVALSGDKGKKAPTDLEPGAVFTPSKNV